MKSSIRRRQCSWPTSVRSINAATGKKDQLVYDDAVPCFGVQVREGDTRKKWIITYELTVKVRADPSQLVRYLHEALEAT